MNHKLITVDPKDLKVGGNTRVDAGMDAEGMANSITERGVQTPLAVWKRPDEKYEIVEGHRRLAGALLSLKRDPKAFKSFHPKGIPAFIRTDITTVAEALVAKVDQGTQKALRFRSERDRAIGLLLDAGLPEKDIICQCEGLLSHFQTSVPSEKKAKIDSLKAAGAEKNREAIRTLLHETYKGQYQTAKAIWDCPPVVRAAMEFLECGQKSTFKSLPSKLTYSDCKKLAKALKADCGIKDANEMPVHSKAEPGPNFKALWAETLKQEKKPGTKQAKAMSAKAMQAELDDGRWASEGFKKLTQHHGGKADVEGLNVIDDLLRKCELVRKYAPERWKAFVDAAKEIQEGVADGSISKG